MYISKLIIYIIYIYIIFIYFFEKIFFSQDLAHSFFACDRTPFAQIELWTSLKEYWSPFLDIERFFSMFSSNFCEFVFFGGVSPNEMLGSHDSDGRNKPDNVRQLQHNQGFFESRLFRAQKPCFWTLRWGRKRRKT